MTASSSDAAPWTLAAAWRVLAPFAALLEGCFLLLRRLQPLDENVVGFISVALAASVLYTIAAYIACRLRESSRALLGFVLVAAAVFRLTLFPLSPTLSADLYRYQWEGRIQNAGYNPYTVRPDDPALAHLRAQPLERFPGREESAAYGPLTELLFRVLAGHDGLLVFKAASVLFDFAALLLVVWLLRLLQLPPARALIYGWCPLVVVEFAGSGHNDSLPLCALLLSLALIIRRQETLSNLALAAAVAAKWFSVVLAPVLLWPRRKRDWRGPLVFAAALVAAFLPYADAGWQLFAGLGAYAEKWRNNESLFAVLVWLTGRDDIAFGIAAVALGGLSLFLAARHADPLRTSLLLLGALLLLSPSVFPWYVTWLVPFLCFFPHPAMLLWTATVLLSYHVLIGYVASGAWQYEPWLVWLEYAPVYALLLAPFQLARRNNHSQAEWPGKLERG